MTGDNGRRRRTERASELRCGSESRKTGEGRVKRAHAQPEVKAPEARPRARGCQGQRRRAMAATVVEEEAEAIAREAPDPCVALRLVAAAAWHVVKKQQVHDFPRVLALLEAVKEAAPDLVHFRHLAKLRLGLQAMVIMRMLQEQQPNGKIYNALDTFFPEGETQPHTKATPQDVEMVRLAQENFRDLVFGLLSDRREKEKYVQEHLEKDYGEAFMQVVEELFHDYLWQLEKTLPEPHLQQLLDAACLQGPSQTPQPDSSILSCYLSTMGYQTAGLPTHPPSPRLSSSLVHSEEEGEHRTLEPSQAHTYRSSSPCAQEQNSPRRRLGNQGMEVEDIVLDSSSDGCSSPFKKGEYQCTRHNTLIPTLQQYLSNTRNQCASSSGSAKSHLT
ncbi:TERF1-interacting nuclear factor 2 isoform X2 [Lacerta agilis]|uniref:TERF1-interacting nuclear factor 2 isoform X2 n=1 Tax=Lacerta agilis TaxID=80427 RepID=UPI001419B29A|nr:TERF1-interacting nuclear factor 2 isoform X2 [Lacerta agilis]